MSTLSTHVLDTSLGKPAAGIRVTLQQDRIVVQKALTDADGRIPGFTDAGASLRPGTYQLRFAVAEYWMTTGRAAFYPEIVIHFMIGTDAEHYHVPLLLSPYGYTTYRGS
jgi:5-hydroxyisourate hydrolase